MRLGAYIHIPFCLSKCPYCNFNSRAGADISLIRRYVDAVTQEIHFLSLQRELSRREIATIFFGGGTPTLLKAADLVTILEAITSTFPIAKDAEITLEANPGTVAFSELCSLHSNGFNRISFGAQSFQPHLLQLLGRTHTAVETAEAIRLARRAGFDNVSVDLIFGVPGQSIEDWHSDLTTATSLSPEHISTYSLTIEPDTLLGQRVGKRELQPVEESTDADMFEMAMDFLGESGYDHYEISNFAKPGRRCQHNLLYWQNEEWLGIGSGAHQHLAGQRKWNVGSPELYVHLMESCGDVTEGRETLDMGTQMRETMFLGLRLCEGLRTQQFRSRYGVAPEELFGAQISSLTRMGLLHREPGLLRLTRQGAMLANVVAREFV